MHVSTFEALHREMFPRLVRYAARSTDAATAEDAAAMALHTLWRKDLDEPADDVAMRSARSLTYRLVEGHLRNLSRADGVRNRAFLRLVDRQRATPSHERDIADVVCVGDRPLWLDALPTTDREVLSLVVDGYAVREIADILDCSAAAVSMRLQRAKGNLREALRQGVDDDVGA